MTIRLILLIGLPGSGKSTLASKLVEEDAHRRVISTDELRSQLFGDAATQVAWLRIWREVGYQFQQTACQIWDGEVSEAIYDATNVVRRQRRQAIALARQTGFTQITGFWLNLPLELCLERNQQRDRQVPEAILLRMHRRLTAAPPTLEEGFNRLVEVEE